MNIRIRRSKGLLKKEDKTASNKITGIEKEKDHYIFKWVCNECSDENYNDCCVLYVKEGIGESESRKPITPADKCPFGFRDKDGPKWVLDKNYKGEEE